MKCEHDKAHDRLSFAALRHLTSLLDTHLAQHKITDQSQREAICSSFIFQAAYFLDNQWVEFDGKRYRVGICFQEFEQDAFAPTRAVVTDYKDGSMLHEAAIGIADAHFTKDDTYVRTFQRIGDAYDKE